MSIQPGSNVSDSVSKKCGRKWLEAGVLAVVCLTLMGVSSGCAKSEPRSASAPRSSVAPAHDAIEESRSGGAAAEGVGPEAEEAVAPPPPPPAIPVPPGASGPSAPVAPGGAAAPKPASPAQRAEAPSRSGASSGKPTATEGKEGIGLGNFGTLGHGAGRGQGYGYGSAGQRPPERQPERAVSPAGDADREDNSDVAAGPLGPPDSASSPDSAPPKPSRRPTAPPDSDDARGPDAAPPAAPSTDGATSGDVPEPEPSKPNTADDTFRDLDDFISRARKGMATFVTPDRIGMEEDTSATLTLNPASVESTGPAQGGEVKVEGVARLAPKMKAVLTGNGFTITTGQSEVQAVSLQEPTQWRWNLRAIEPGPQRLTVTLSAVVKVEDEPVERVIQTFDRTVEVNADAVETVARFVMANWEFVFGSLILPFGAWAWSLRTGKQKEEEDG